MRLVVSLLLLAVLLSAQTGTGVFKGTVQDSTGAVVPAAQVTLTNVDTQAVRATTATELGYYYLPSLPPGDYRLVVQAPGFKKWEATARLEVGQTATIDPKMEVGTVDTVLEVADAAPVIATEGAAIGDVKDFLRIRQLPLNGRSVTTLFNLTAGVEGGGNPRINGLKVGSAEMMLDGVSIVDRFGGGINRVSPGLDTIQEFRIETTGSSAQFSRPANIELVTKSGTNEFHGSAFETHRNNFGGLRARQRQDGNTPAKLIRNEFGASAGGPVYLPKIYDGRNHTFWFVGYEAFRQRQLTFYQDVVPTEAMWAGNFNGIIDAAGRQTNIYDPLTTGADGRRTPFAGNVVPAARIAPIYKTVQAITHLPTSNVNPYQGINMVEYYPNILNTNSTSVKVDHRFSDKDSISGRFTRSNRYNQLTGGRFGAPRADSTDGFGSGRGQTPIYSVSIRETHIFSPTLFHDLMLATHRTANSNGTLADNTNWAQRLGLPNPFGVNGWPTFYTDNFGWDADNRKDEKLTNHNIESNTTWIKGRHTVKFGGKIRQEYNNVRELQQAQGSHDFAGDWTAQYIPADDTATAFTGDGLASMALGLPTYLSNQFNRGYFYFEQKEMGLYVTDSWKVNQRLTLDLGVRWDKWTPYKEKYDRLVNLDLNALAGKFEVLTPGSTRMEDLQGIPPAVLTSWARRGLTWRTANDAGFPSSLLRADNNNFGPRLAFAYRIAEKFVLRGGYGEYFWTMPLSQILQASRTNPPLNLRFETPLASLDGTSTFAVRTVPTADMYVGRATVSTEGIVELPPSARGMVAADGRNWADGRSRSWNFTIERELMKSTALRLSYVGTQGRDMEQRYTVNPREAEYNWVARTGTVPPGNRDLMRVNKDWSLTAINKSGISSTNTLQAEVERRYSNGLAFQWFYVFSRSLTTSDEGGFSAGSGNINAVGSAVAQVPSNELILGGGKMSFDDLRRLVYYNSGNVPAHRVRWNGVYDLPFGKGKKYGNGASGLVNHIIGGWQLATIGDWRSGTWMGVTAGQYLFGDPTLNADQRLLMTYAGRPQRLWFRGNFNPTLATNVDQQALQALIPLNQADRVLRPLGPNLDNRLPQTLANGTTRLTPITDTVNWNARNFFRGPGAWTVDASLFKNFQLAEKVQLRFTADFFNMLNHPLDNNPNATTGLQDLATQPNDPRIVQFSARISW